MKNTRAVTGTERMNFLRAKFDDSTFDTKVFLIADRMIENYTGGFWDYMTDDEHLAFLSLYTDSEKLDMQNIFSGESVSVPKLLASLIVTSFALAMRLEKGDASVALYDTYDKLKEEIMNECFTDGGTGSNEIWMVLMD